MKDKDFEELKALVYEHANTIHEQQGQIARLSERIDKLGDQHRDDNERFAKSIRDLKIIT